MANFFLMTVFFLTGEACSRKIYCRISKYQGKFQFFRGFLMLKLLTFVYKHIQQVEQNVFILKTARHCKMLQLQQYFRLQFLVQIVAWRQAVVNYTLLKILCELIVPQFVIELLCFSPEQTQQELLWAGLLAHFKITQMQANQQLWWSLKVNCGGKP